MYVEIISSFFVVLLVRERIRRSQCLSTEQYNRLLKLSIL